MRITKKALSLLLAVMMAASVMVVAAVPASAAKVGDIILFGNYPQTKVSETTALKNAANAATWKSYGYYIGTGNIDGKMAASDFMKYADFFSNGVKYRAVKFTKYRPMKTSWISSADNSKQDDNGYFTNTTYYFKYEPLKWRVLDPNSGHVVCETIIDSQAYQNIVRKSASDNYYIGKTATFANSYAESTIRTWQNNDFFNTAFNTAQKNKIIPIQHNNDAYSSYSQYNSVSTTDQIFFLNYNNVINVGVYGFPNANARKAKGTDYAKCQGLDVDDSGFSAWRLGSAGDFDDVVCNVGSDGSSFISNNVSATDCGIRPSCCLSNLTSDVSQSEIYTVTATADPTAGGTVTGGGTYTDGTTATVTATANSSYMFSGWYKGGRNVSSNKSYTFTVTGNVTLTAKFAKLSMSYNVTATADPAEGGSVTGGGSYSDGQTAALTATANSGWHFTGWFDGSNKVSSDASYSFTVAGKVTLTAKFEKDSYTVTVTANPSEGGTVTGGGTYETGAYATLTATPNSGWHFVGWYQNGAQVSTQQSFFRPVVSDLAYVAKFEKDAPVSYTVSVSADPAEGGTVTGGGSYSEGKTATVTATPKTGWHFTGWFNGSTKVSSDASYSFTIAGNVTLTAKFEKDARTVSFNANGGTGTMNAVTFNGSYTVPACTFTPPAGKTFDCWKLSGGNKTYKPGDSLDATGTNITLLAQWKNAQSEQPQQTVKRGDVDFDGKIAAADARLCLRRSVGLETYPEGSKAFIACDVDFSNTITAADARLILRASVGLEDTSTWG